MHIAITLRSAYATEFTADEAFDAFNEATAIYPDWAFRLRSGGDVGRYRLEAWKIAEARSGWIACAAATAPAVLHQRVA